MFKRLYPNEMLDSVYELPIETLKSAGIKGVIFDIDNTLVPYDVAEPTNEVMQLIRLLETEGFKVVLLSNNTEDRVIRFNEKLKVFAVHKAQKPLRKNFKRALELLQCKKEEVIIVGDQLFTDVYGGNRMGMQTFLVKPISDKDEWQVKLKRHFEKIILKYYQRQQKR